MLIVSVPKENTTRITRNKGKKEKAKVQVGGSLRSELRRERGSLAEQQRKNKRKLSDCSFSDGGKPSDGPFGFHWSRTSELWRRRRSLGSCHSTGKTLLRFSH
jgi:hypothetical protein